MTAFRTLLPFYPSPSPLNTKLPSAFQTPPTQSKSLSLFFSLTVSQKSFRFLICHTFLHFLGNQPTAFSLQNIRDGQRREADEDQVGPEEVELVREAEPPERELRGLRRRRRRKRRRVKRSPPGLRRKVTEAVPCRIGGRRPPALPRARREVVRRLRRRHRQRRLRGRLV